jgi:histidine triad (HIT) family protein
MADTFFTKIIRREIPADIVFEDEQVIAFRDIGPQAPTHILIIPRTPIATTNEISTEQEPLVGHMVVVAAKIARQEGIADTGYRLVFNCNADAGQAVFHIHLHLLGGRKLSWPPG